MRTFGFTVWFSETLVLGNLCTVYSRQSLSVVDFLNRSEPQEVDRIKTEAKRKPFSRMRNKRSPEPFYQTLSYCPTSPRPPFSSLMVTKAALTTGSPPFSSPIVKNALIWLNWRYCLFSLYLGACYHAFLRRRLLNSYFIDHLRGLCENLRNKSEVCDFDFMSWFRWMLSLQFPAELGMRGSSFPLIMACSSHKHQ